MTNPTPVLALPMATTLEAGIPQMETRLGHKKILLPVPLIGTEDPSTRALVYYAATAKIDAEGASVSHRIRLMTLAGILNLNSVIDLTIGRLLHEYEIQLWNPMQWDVISYHDNTGLVLPNTVLNGNNVILKSIGSSTANTPLNNLRAQNITFVLVRAIIDFNEL